MNILWITVCLFAVGALATCIWLVIAGIAEDEYYQKYINSQEHADEMGEP